MSRDHRCTRPARGATEWIDHASRIAQRLGRAGRDIVQEPGRRTRMTLDLMKERGIPLEKQEFDWNELAGKPTSKLDDDAFTRVRVILMNGIESEALRFGHACARMNRTLQR